MGAFWEKFKTKGFAVKPPSEVLPARPADGDKVDLNRTLGPLDLLLFGIGGIVGSGVFVLTGEVAKEYAG